MNTNLDFLQNLAKFYQILSRSLDAKLGWLGFNDFLVLYHLSKNTEWKLRRIDLAEKVWLTASWVTRLLLPMEKIGLVKKEINPSDARVSQVSITLWWETKLNEALERINFFIEEIFPENQENIADFIELMQKIGGKILWN